MASHSPPERPPRRRRFITSREIEEMAGTGAREILVASDWVITDAAREAAADLGIRLLKERAVVSVISSPAESPMETARANPARTAEADRPALGGAMRSARDGEVVNAIVDSFRRASRLDPSEREVREVVMQVLSATNAAWRRG